jgi:hypothetical protein
LAAGALVSVRTGDVVALRACRRYMQAGRLALVMRTDGNTVVARTEAACPVHDTADCVETYFAAGYVSRWSWRGWWAWRRARRAGGAE